MQAAGMAKPEPLYMTESEIAACVGVPLADWKDIAVVLEKLGLPPRDPLFKNKRYWPACKAFLDRRNKVETQSHRRVEGRAAAMENWG